MGTSLLPYCGGCLSHGGVSAPVLDVLAIGRFVDDVEVRGGGIGSLGIVGADLEVVALGWFDAGGSLLARAGGA